MNIKLGNLIHGGGRRRATTESYADLGKENRQLRDDASRLDPCMCQNPGRHVEFLIRRPVGATAPVVPFGCPACLVDQLRGQHRAQLSVLTAPSAPPSPVLVPAAADVVGSAFAGPALVAVSDPRLRIVADTPPAPDESEASDVNAETQAVAVSSLWDAIGEGETTARRPCTSKTPSPPSRRSRSSRPRTWSSSRSSRGGRRSPRTRSPTTT
jgi:hypothetical protein